MATRIFRYTGAPGQTLPSNRGGRRSLLPDRRRAAPGAPWGARRHPFGPRGRYGGFGGRGGMGAIDEGKYTAFRAAGMTHAQAEAAATIEESFDWAGTLGALTQIGLTAGNIYGGITEAEHRRRIERRLADQGIAVPPVPPPANPTIVTRPPVPPPAPAPAAAPAAGGAGLALAAGVGLMLLRGGL